MEADQIEDLEIAIADMVAEGTDLTMNGMPEMAVLRGKVAFDITADDRKEAYECVMARDGPPAEDGDPAPEDVPQPDEDGDPGPEDIPQPGEDELPWCWRCEKVVDSAMAIDSGRIYATCHGQTQGKFPDGNTKGGRSVFFM